MIKRIAVVAFAVSASACAAVPPDVDEVPVHGVGKCDAARAQSLVGQQASSALGADALRTTGAAGLRWIPPGAAVTMDYREDRLNIELDRNNRVSALRCG
jgi:hypothetical protein